MLLKFHIKTDLYDTQALTKLVSSTLGPIFTTPFTMQSVDKTEPHRRVGVGPGMSQTDWAVFAI